MTNREQKSFTNPQELKEAEEIFRELEYRDLLDKVNQKAKILLDLFKTKIEENDPDALKDQPVWYDEVDRLNVVLLPVKLQDLTDLKELLADTEKLIQKYS